MRQQRQRDGAAAAASVPAFPALHGRDLRRLRRERGMLQRDLARALGVHPVLVSFVECDLVHFSPAIEARLVRALWPLAAGDAGTAR
jgi:DNA-binding XRE family transcriptional regulator